MLDIIKKIFTPFEERAKSPFYSSFIVSWLIVNWKIVYAIFSSEIKIEEVSVISYISSQLTPLNYFVYPLTLSLIYVFAIPRIDEFITPIIERIKNRTIAKKLKETNATIVSGDRYVELWKQYKNVKGSFAEIEKDLQLKEANLQEQENKYQQTEEKLLQLKNENREQQERLEQLAQRNSMDYFFKGKWRIVYTTNDGTIRSDYLISFSGNQIMRSEESRGIYEYSIIYADYDAATSTTNAILQTINDIPAFEKDEIIRLYLTHSKDSLEPHKLEGSMERLGKGVTQRYKVTLNKA